MQIEFTGQIMIKMTFRLKIESFLASLTKVEDLKKFCLILDLVKYIFYISKTCNQNFY